MECLAYSEFQIDGAILLVRTRVMHFLFYAFHKDRKYGIHSLMTYRMRDLFLDTVTHLHDE